MSEAEFFELANRWLNGQCSDEESAALEKILKENSKFRKAFLRLTNLEVGLRDLGSGTEEVAAVPFAKTSQWSKTAVIGWAVAALIGVAAIVMSPLDPNDLNREDDFAGIDETEEGDHPVAVLSKLAEAVWSESSQHSPAEGGAIGTGVIALESGLVQIDFFGGASVSLSGPAELELVSHESAILHAGVLTADVPPAARGFEVRTGEIFLEDLGTRFGLSAVSDSEAELYVFDGEVRATGVSGDSILVAGGEGMELKNGKAIPQDSTKTEKYPHISEVYEGAGSEERDRYSNWREASLELRQDPRLIAYYDFENLSAQTRRLKNRVQIDKASELDGGIVGARMAEGRWAGKTALDFRGEGDRVRFEIPGEWNAVTLFAWVRIDALDRHLSSLFLTDFFDPNEFHWQISSKGALHFATSPEGVIDIPKHNRRFYSDIFWNPKMSGRWFFLATTVDCETNAVQHYINGEPVGFSGGTNREKPLTHFQIGKADLGNWSDPIWPEAAIRTLNGRIDEFAIFQEALIAEEIRKLYVIGKP